MWHGAANGYLTLGRHAVTLGVGGNDLFRPRNLGYFPADPSRH
jgi:hypothetical protein